MEGTSAKNYYVFEYVFGNQPCSYIGWSSANPSHAAEQICISLRSSKIPKLSEWLRKSKNDDETGEFIELEVVESTEQAVETVEIWRNYYKFLGVETVAETEAQN